MANPEAVPQCKRGYTVTDRVLAACRVNVQKAQKAALELRFCANRGTDAERKASRIKLELAQRVKREDNTYKYCSSFRHGLGVPDLERSLVMAGESRDEYHAHLARFAALPAVFQFGVASQQVKLAKACGYVSWRRLRAFRLQSEWALRMMVYQLNEAIRIRSNGGTGTPACADFAVAIGGTQPGAAVPPDFANSLPVQPLSLTPERFVELGLGLERGAGSWPSVWRAVTKLDNRFDQLWCTLVTELGEPEPLLARLRGSERAGMRVSPVVANYELYPAEVLGNPLLRPMALLKLLRPQLVYVKPVEEWPSAQLAYEVQSRSMAELRRSTYIHIPEEKQLRLKASLGNRLLREARKPRGAQRDPALAYDVPGTFEEFLALMEAAFGEGPEIESQGSGAGEGRAFSLAAEHGQDGHAMWHGLPAREAGLEAPPFPDSVQLPAPAQPPTLRHLAELLWDAATLPRRRAEEEADSLAELLADYADGLASTKPEDASQRQDIAANILKLFREAEDEQVRSVGLCCRARLALYDLAVARFGKHEGFELLKNPDDRLEQLEREWFDLNESQVPRDEEQEARRQEQKAKGKSQEARAQRKEPRGKRKKAKEVVNRVREKHQGERQETSDKRRKVTQE